MRSLKTMPNRDGPAMADTPKVITTYVFPPIPSRRFDWSAHYEGEEDEKMDRGWGRTQMAAVMDLKDNYPRPKLRFERDEYGTSNPGKVDEQTWHDEVLVLRNELARVKASNELLRTYATEHDQRYLNAALDDENKILRAAMQRALDGPDEDLRQHLHAAFKTIDDACNNS